MSTTTNIGSNSGHSDKKDKRHRKKTLTGFISQIEHDDLQVSFDLVIKFFERYALFHDLSDAFVAIIKDYGPIPSPALDELMKKFHNSQTQFGLFLKGREQTLKVMENICMERFGAALRNFHQLRRSADLLQEIDAQQRNKVANLKKHSGYAISDDYDKSTISFTVASPSSHGGNPAVEQMKKDRESRLAMESLALRGIRQLMKITSRNEEQVKYWKAARQISPR